jgi:hypothetical protein
MRALSTRADTVIWADSLLFAGFNNWRIPAWEEMAHLYFRELGSHFWIDGGKPFTNLALPEWYHFTGEWNELPYMDSSFFDPLYYDPGRHDPSSDVTDGIRLGWAVQPGFRETVQSTVPVPPTILMLGPALLGLPIVRKWLKD